MKADNYRTEPHIWHVNYPTLLANRKVFELFRSKVRGDLCHRMLDIGCGRKPFDTLFKDIWYLGTDLDTLYATPDVVALNNGLPFPDGTFDAAIVSETLEHTLGYEFAVQEVRRVTRDKGYIYVSVPFVHPMHHHPFDFQRITEFRLFDLFKQDEIVEFQPSNTIFSTWIMALEFALVTMLHVLPGRRYSVAVAAFFLNAIALGIDGVAQSVYSLLMQIPGVSERLAARIVHPRAAYGVLTAMPCGYSLVIRLDKAKTGNVGTSNGPDQW